MVRRSRSRSALLYFVCPMTTSSSSPSAAIVWAWAGPAAGCISRCTVNLQSRKSSGCISLLGFDNEERAAVCELQGAADLELSVQFDARSIGKIGRSQAPNAKRPACALPKRSRRLAGLRIGATRGDDGINHHLLVAAHVGDSKFPLRFDTAFFLDD